MDAQIPDDDFMLRSDGRSGVISYTCGTHAIDIPWEMSGSSRYHILVAPLDLRHWDVPTEEPIPRAQQKDILVRLRRWLASQSTRSDIDLPTQTEQSPRTCAWYGCQRMSLADSAYCPEHFDETLLRP